MSRVTGKPPTHWRRPITRTYDYNMNLGENYYKPQLDYIESRRGRGKTPPSATTFAERLLKFPPSQRSSSATRRAEESSRETGTSSYSNSAVAGESSMGRYASLDDLGLDEEFTRRRRQLLQASQENLNLDRGASPSFANSKGQRVTFGDKVLDAVGVKESSLSSSMKSGGFSNEEGDAIDKILAERRNRRQQGLLAIKSADADLYTEDPLKSPNISSRLQQARREMDSMRDEMRIKNEESNSASSRFRQRLRAKRERELRDEEQDNQFFGGSLSSLNEVGSLSPQISAASKARQFLADNSSSERGMNSSAMSSSGRSSSMQQLKVSSVSSSSSASKQQSKNMFAVDDDDSETAAILNKVEQIRQRAKARLAQITDEDFPDLQIGSSLASRRAAGRQLNFDDDFDSSSSGGGRAVTVSKRTVRASYDIE